MDQGCGSVRPGDQAVPVRVYRVSTAGRSHRAGQPDDIRRTASAIYLSDATGYPLIYRPDTTTVIARILSSDPARLDPVPNP